MARTIGAPIYATGFSRSLAATPPEEVFTNTYSTLFDGVDEWVNIPKVTAHNVSTTMSASVWIKSSTTTGAQAVFAHHDAGSLSDQSFLIQVSPGDTNKLQFNIYDGVNSVRKAYRTSIVIVDGTWHHVVMTFGSSTLKIYVDGVEDTSTTKLVDLAISSINSTNPSALSAAIRLSGSLPNPGTYFTGNLDEISYWNSELSASAVSELYNAGTPDDLNNHSAIANLIGWWRMGDNDTFPTITDQTGSSDGTMNNMESGDFVADTP